MIDPLKELAEKQKRDKALAELKAKHARPAQDQYIDPRVRDAFAESYQGKAGQQLDQYTTQRVTELQPQARQDNLAKLNALLKSDVASKGKEIAQSYWGPEAVINSQAPKPVEDNGLGAFNSGKNSFAQSMTEIFMGIPKAISTPALNINPQVSMPVGGFGLSPQNVNDAADWMINLVREESPTNPAQDTANQIGGTGGALAAFALGGALGRTVKAAELAIPSVSKAVLNQTAQHLPAAVMASAGTASSEYELALQETGSHEVAYQAFEKNLFSGVPFLLSPTIKAFNTVTGGALKQIAGSAAQGGLTGMFQMGTSHALSNVAAQDTYDKTRSIVDGVLGAGGSGFAINAAISGILRAPAVMRNRAATEYAQKAHEKTKDLGNTDYYKEAVAKKNAEIEAITGGLPGEIKAEIDRAAGLHDAAKAGEPASVTQFPKSETITPITDAVSKPQAENLDVRQPTTDGQTVAKGEAPQEVKKEVSPEVKSAKENLDKAYEEFNRDQTEEAGNKLLEAQQAMTQAVTKNKSSRKNPYSDEIKALEEATDEETMLSRARLMIERFPDKARKLTDLLYQASGKNATEGTRNKFFAGLRDAANISPTVVTTEAKIHKNFLRDWSRGIREGRIDAKNDLRSMLDTIKETIGKMKLPDRIHKSILNKVRNLNFTNPEKVAKVEDYVIKVTQDAKVAAQIDSIEQLQDAVKNRYKKLPRSQQEIVKKLIDADVSAISNFSDVHNALKSINANLEPVTSELYERVPDMELLRPIAEQAAMDSHNASVRRRAERYADMNPEVLDFLESDTKQSAELDEAARTEAREALDVMTEPLREEMKEVERPSEDLKGKIFDSFNNLPKEVTDKLTLDDLKTIIRKMDQMVTNNDFSNTQELASKIEMARTSDRLEPFKREMTKRIFSTPTATFEHLYKQASEKMTKFYANSGLGRLISGDSKAKNSVHEFRVKAKKLMDDIQGKFWKKINLHSEENSAKSSVYSNLIQIREGMSELDAVESNKQDILNSIEGATFAKDLKTAEFQRKALEKFEGANTIVDIQKVMAKNNPEIKKWVDGLIEIVSKYYDISASQAEVLFGRALERITNYLPRKTAVLSGNQDFEKTGFTINPTEGRSLLERNPIGARNYINSKDFFPTIFENISQLITNHEIQPAAHDIKAFFEMDAANGYKWTGGKESHDMLSNYLKQTVFGFGKASNWFPDFALFDIINRQAINTTLAGIGGKVKQYGPGAVRLLTQYANRPGLVFGNGSNTQWAKKLRDEFPIASRSKRFQGVYVGDVTSSEKIAQGLIGKLEGAQEYLSQGLPLGGKEFAKGDANIAERAWTASYLDYLSKNGIDVSDTSNEFWKNEYDLRNTPLRKEAAQAGETYVGVNMLPSTGREIPPLFNRMSKEAKMFFPFLSYQMSLGQRMNDRWRTILTSATGAEKSSATKKLIGDIAEAVSFNYVFNEMIVQTALDWASAQYMEHYGLEEDEDVKADRIRKREARGTLQTVSSLVPHPAWQMASGLADDALVYLSNKELYKTREDEDQKFSDWKDESGIPDYATADRRTIPIIDVLARQFGDNWDIEGDDLVYEGQNGNMVRRPLTSDEKALLENAWLSLTLSHLGLKDFADIMKRAERATVKQVKKNSPPVNFNQ